LKANSLFNLRMYIKGIIIIKDPVEAIVEMIIILDGIILFIGDCEGDFNISV
jgi:hypothetical protein